MADVDLSKLEKAAEELAVENGILMMMGDTDSGKSTFCRMLVNSVLRLGRKCAVVDMDIGQSEIGPPGCVGWGVPEAEIQSLSDIPVHGISFVGSSNPIGRMLEHVTASTEAVRKAQKEKPDIILIDTTGLIQGESGRRLKMNKIRSLSPNHLIAIQKGAECEHILQSFGKSKALKVHRLERPLNLGYKSRALRIQRRKSKFASYFLNSQIHQADMRMFAFSGVWLGTGNVCPFRQVTSMSEILKENVYYAECIGAAMNILVGSLDVRQENLARLQQSYPEYKINLFPALAYHNLLVGLEDADGRLLGLGILQKIDFCRATFEIQTPLITLSAASHIRAGLLRLHADGNEIELLRPGVI
jgi:polynucleotide 5'-hydroxyl-kinase GRC3/NOL9